MRHRVAQQVPQHAGDALRVYRADRALLSRHFDSEMVVASIGVGFVGNLLGQHGQIHLLALQGDGLQVESGDLEKLLYQALQAHRAIAGDGDVALFGVIRQLWSFAEQVEIAYHRSHRRPQVVGQVGNQLILAMLGGVSRLIGSNTLAAHLVKLLFGDGELV